MPPVVEVGRVIENIHEGPGCYRLWLEAPAVAAVGIPGQFVNLKVPDTLTPLLRRPFSFCDLDPAGGRFSVLFQAVGPTTRQLARLAAGADVSIVGPLGKGFHLDSPTGSAILCAGGIGIAPFPALARALHGRSRQRAIIGARTAALCLCQEDFKRLGIPVELATEDGSAGAHGFVTEPLTTALASSDPDDITVYACGPQPMLFAVAEICRRQKVRAQLSVEAVMGCGVGACLSCVFRTPDGRFIRSCVEGPVFGHSEVLF